MFIPPGAYTNSWDKNATEDHAAKTCDFLDQRTRVCWTFNLRTKSSSSVNWSLKYKTPTSEKMAPYIYTFKLQAVEYSRSVLQAYTNPFYYFHVMLLDL